MKIYFAGPLFTLAEQNFNRNLRDELVLLGHEVFLPQESEVHKRKELFEREHHDMPFDYSEIAKDDEKAVYDCDVLTANLDGPMVDDGTSVEVGLARARGKKTLGYRTDFRVSGDDPKNRLNLMFRLMDKIIFYGGNDISELAYQIHIAIS